MKIEFVKPTAGNYEDEMMSYITEGKIYPILKVLYKTGNMFLVTIKDDTDEIISPIVNTSTSHLSHKGMFIPCDKDGKEVYGE